MIVGIIGNGFIGRALYQLKCKDIDILVYDINSELCIPKEIVLNDLNECDIIFISVPTPMSKNGSCYLNIIESVIANLQSINYNGFIVIRSTVPVGTCDKFNCYFMPEFLTEKNYMNDFVNNKNWIFGLLDVPEDELIKEKIIKLFDLAYTNKKIIYNNISFVTNKEAEMIKMFKNCFLATKVSFCNEIYEFCEKKQINYEIVRKLATTDDRILTSHSIVPGPDGKRGFGGTCFPKDTSSLRYEMRKNNMTPYIMNAIIERNEKVDRPEKDWLMDKGRVIVDE